jgi:hypothetical protein
LNACRLIKALGDLQYAIAAVAHEIPKHQEKKLLAEVTEFVKLAGGKKRAVELLKRADALMRKPKSPLAKKLKSPLATNLKPPLARNPRERLQADVVCCRWRADSITRSNCSNGQWESREDAQPKKLRGAYGLLQETGGSSRRRNCLPRHENVPLSLLRHNLGSL